MDITTPGSEEVFHYTSIGGLHGILESGEMWGTHIKFLNDSRELVHGRELLRQAILVRLQGREEYDGLSILVEKAMEQFESSVFVACFSRLRDDLPQWRGYASESGVSIGFAGLPMCFPVTYANDPANSSICKRADSCVSAIDQFSTRFKITPSDTTSKDGDNDDSEILAALGKMLNDMYPNVFLASVLVKSESFAAENEQRIVEVVQQSNLYSRVRFRVDKGALLPYVGIPLGSPAHFTRVIVGPNPRADLVADGVRMLLDANGHSEVPVELSKVSFRN